jgi:translation initiation factor 4A
MSEPISSNREDRPRGGGSGDRGGDRSGDRYTRNERYNKDRYDNGSRNNYRGNNRRGGSGSGSGSGSGNRNDYYDRKSSSYNREETTDKQATDNQTIDNEKVQNEDMPKIEITPLSAEDIARREEFAVPIATFDDLSSLIDLKLIRGVMAYGFEYPSPIQQKAIKPLLGGYDVIAQAQSGTGKTATFCIGTLGNIDYTKNEIQAIVLGHTMELAQQIEIVFKNIGKYLDVRVGQAVRSIPVRDNIDQLLGKTTDGKLPQVVIGTPGRVLDMINKKVINTSTIKMLVLDEADELLSDGFLQQIRNIIGNLNSEVQIGLFSATMEPAFFKITQNFMRHPMNILIKKEELTLEGIKQFYIDCEKNEYKFETLCDLYSLISVSQTIIYCNHYQSVEQLTKKLQEQNFKVSCIHGNMNITEREDAMRNFRNMNSRVLISTDLLGRGIDVQQVSVVINYDIPLKIESYIHRIGRSGRHGRKGTAINFVNGNDFKRMTDIEKYYNTHIAPLPGNVEQVLNAN